MARIEEIKEVALADLNPYDKNAKIHGGVQVDLIAKSIEEFGFLNPCLIDKDNNIIAGHGRVMAAKQLGWTTVPCVYIEGLTEEQYKAYVLADNKLTELGEWDMELVTSELNELLDKGFDIELTGFELDDTIIDTSPIDDDGLGGEIEELVNEKEPTVKRGQVYELGEHRLMCGDSTDLEDVYRLVDGNSIDLMVTDPPYNVAIQNSKGMKIENDDMEDSDFYDFLYNALSNACAVMREGAGFYIWHADSEGLNFRRATKDAGLTTKQNLIWVKNSFSLGRQDYQWKHEPCLYGWKEGKAHYFQNARNISTIFKSAPEIEEMTREQLVDYINALIGDSTVWEENKPQADDLHPTMKPISLIEKQIKNSSKKDEIVLDLFGGSGTTLIACEKLGRKCFMMEYDPHYAEVIIERWENETGKKAKLV